MKKLMYTLNALLMSIIFLNTISIKCMKNSRDALSLTKEEYNNNLCLINNLPDEMLIGIFSHCLVKNDLSVDRALTKVGAKSEDQVKSVENSIKTFIQLRTICKSFNKLLPFETIGNLCKGYAQYDKDHALIYLEKKLEQINDNNRLRILILLHAGANVNASGKGNYLILYSTIENNKELNTILFKHHANPNAQIDGLGPVFFFAETIAMAHTFINSDNFNIHATNNYPGTNVLWKTTQDNYPSELMRLYLAYNVDTRKLDTYYNSCLLHELAKQHVKENNDNFLKKANLLLTAIPDMINSLNRWKQTPIDVAQASLEISDNPEAFEQLIALFRNSGGLTAQELKVKNKLFIITNNHSFFL